jgi:hypothetical protein
VREALLKAFAEEGIEMPVAESPAGNPLGST